MVQNRERERQPHNQLKLLWVMGNSERLRLLVGHALIHKCTHDIEITTKCTKHNQKRGTKYG